MTSQNDRLNAAAGTVIDLRTRTFSIRYVVGSWMILAKAGIMAMSPMTSSEAPKARAKAMRNVLPVNVDMTEVATPSLITPRKPLETSVSVSSLLHPI